MFESIGRNPDRETLFRHVAAVVLIVLASEAALVLTFWGWIAWNLVLLWARLFWLLLAWLEVPVDTLVFLDDLEIVEVPVEVEPEPFDTWEPYAADEAELAPLEVPPMPTEAPEPVLQDAPPPPKALKVEAGMLAMLGTEGNGEFANVLSAREGEETFSLLMAVEGTAVGTGGLRLRGSGVGGGGVVKGLGGVGTLGRPRERERELRRPDRRATFLGPHPAWSSTEACHVRVAVSASGRAKVDTWVDCSRPLRRDVLGAIRKGRFRPAQTDDAPVDDVISLTFPQE